MSAKFANRSNISGQLKETSGMKAYTARPTAGEAREGGPLGCLHVTHGSLATAKQLPLLWVVMCMPYSQRFPLAVR